MNIMDPADLGIDSSLSICMSNYIIVSSIRVKWYLFCVAHDFLDHIPLDWLDDPFITVI